MFNSSAYCHSFELSAALVSPENENTTFKMGTYLLSLPLALPQCIAEGGKRAWLIILSCPCPSEIITVISYSSLWYPFSSWQSYCPLEWLLCCWRCPPVVIWALLLEFWCLCDLVWFFDFVFFSCRDLLSWRCASGFYWLHDYPQRDKLADSSNELPSSVVGLFVYF